MLRILSLIRLLRSRSLSATMLGLATAALLAWIPVHATLILVADDGTILRNALAVADDHAVREQVAELIAAGGGVAGSPAALDDVTDAIRADAPLSGPMTDALAQTFLITRDRVMAQFGRPEGTRFTPVSVPAGPLLSALGTPFAAELSGLEVPLVPAAQVAQLETTHSWAVQIDRWGLPVAAIAGLIGVIAGRRPWRSLAILAALVAAAAAVAPPAFGWAGDLLGRGGLGAWALLIAPILSVTQAAMGASLVPVAIGSAGLAVLFLLIHGTRRRRR